MRGMRWLLLVAIAAILGGVVYQVSGPKKTTGRQRAGRLPAALAADLSASSQHWSYRDKDLKTGRIIADIDAESMQQVKDASRVDLKNVTMKIYGKDGQTYDLVKSAAASLQHHGPQSVFAGRCRDHAQSAGRRRSPPSSPP